MHLNRAYLDRQTEHRTHAFVLANVAWWSLVLILLLAALPHQAAIAQTQAQAVQRQLEAPAGTNSFCEELGGPAGSVERADFDANVGPQLANICSIPGGPPGSLSGGVAAGNAVGTEGSTFVEERLLERRGEEEEKKSFRANLWFSARGESLNRDITVFEDGYDSHTGGAVLGMDKRWNNWLLAGAAFNYTRWEGDFDGGGDFSIDSYGPVFYASIMPAENAFADVSFGYSKKTGDRSRFTTFEKPGVFQPQVFSGTVKGDIDADEFNFNMLLGFDHAIQRYTIGPRLGVAYSRVETKGFTESGTTGLELRYLDDQVTSFQTKLGIVATSAFSARFGVLSVQLNADWTHEVANDQRYVAVQFAQDLRASRRTFVFQTEPPDRDFYHVGAGVVAVFPNGLQSFVKVEAIFGHSYLSSYASWIGVRWEL